MEEFPPVLNQIKKLYNEDLKSLDAKLEKYNAPWTAGRIPDWKIKQKIDEGHRNMPLLVLKMI